MVRAVGKWTAMLAERAAEVSSAPPPRSPDKTDETRVLSVLAVGPQGDALKTCAANEAKSESSWQQDRPYKLTPAEADAAHAGPWDDATIARFVARVGLFIRRGLDATDADELAERLVLRDMRSDDRVCCAECAHYRPGRCGNHRRAGLHSAEVGRDFAAMVQRCQGFTALEVER